MTDSLTPLLIDAKKEYTLRLAEVMSPFVIQFIDTTYRTAKKEAGDRKAFLEFQSKLRQVPSWNQAIIEQYTRDIENRYGYFSDLVAAVFVTYVKVLSSIKISSDRPNVKLKLPQNSAFVHQVYLNTAKNFYENPYVVKESQQTKASLVLNAIESSVRTMLPLGDVLEAYLSSAVNEDNMINPVLSPAQSLDGNEGEDDDDNEADVPSPPPGGDDHVDSESDFDDDEKVIPGVSEQPILSPINDPFPDDSLPPQQAMQPLSMQPPMQPPVPLPQIPTTPATGIPQQQPMQKTFPRPLFADATDGEHQFR